jgi:hypothetical protein
MLRNGVDLQQLLFGTDFLAQILDQINFSQPPNCVRYISWCLYIISKRYYHPNPNGNGAFQDKQY